MEQPSDSPRERLIRQRFEDLLRTHQADLVLTDANIKAAVNGLTFFVTEGRPVFRITANFDPPDAAMALADRAVDEILAEEHS